MVRVEMLLWITQIILTVGVIVSAVVSWLRNGVVVRKVREGIGLDEITETLDEIQDSQEQTHDDVRELGEEVKRAENGIVALSFAISEEGYEVDPKEFQHRFMGDEEVGMFDFVDKTRSPDGGRVRQKDETPGDDRSEDDEHPSADS